MRVWRRRRPSTYGHWEVSTIRGLLLQASYDGLNIPTLSESFHSMIVAGSNGFGNVRAFFKSVVDSTLFNAPCFSTGLVNLCS